LPIRTIRHPVANAARLSLGKHVVISPGVYSSNPAFGARCYFLAGGDYRWQSGYTNNGGLVSNELVPLMSLTSTTTHRSPAFSSGTWMVSTAQARSVQHHGNGGQPMGTWGSA